MNHSLDAIFKPRSVAIIGASTKKGTLGREIFDKILSFEFNGPVYPVNPKAQYVHSVKAFKSISSIGEQIDLAVIVVRKELVLNIVKECAKYGVKGIIVITAGFKETGPEGAALEEKIVTVVRQHGMRMIGPNCMGVINTEPDIRLDATFAPIETLRGNVALISQSGALGQTILEHALELNLGISMFVSVGNKADVSANDLLEYWQNNPDVQVILMYLESFGNPRKFIELAKKTSMQKPIVIVKSGRTTSGAKAATSHTGSLAGLDIAFNALFKQCGIIRADTINEMFDIALGMANLPLPKSNRVAIITNAGGPGIMAADACDSYGLKVSGLTSKTKSTLKSKLVTDASINNPIDLLAGAQPEQFQLALKLVLEDVNVDAVVVIFVAPIITDPTQVARKISEVAQQFDKPVLGCFMGVKGVATGIEELHRQRLPAYPFPESAVRTLSAMVRYRQWLEKDVGRNIEFHTDINRAQKIIRTAQAENKENLAFHKAIEILQVYEIPFVETRTHHTIEELLLSASEMKFPLALKVVSDKVIHKSEFGAVKLGIRTPDELKQSFEKICLSLRNNDIKPESVSFVLQEFLQGGREVIMGLHHVPGFGSLVMFGLGGIYVEVLEDVVFRIAPITDKDAEEMIHEIKGLPILQGVRGEKSVPFDFLKAMLLRISQISQDLPEIREMDLNPFLVFSNVKKCKAVDARISMALSGKARSA